MFNISIFLHNITKHLSFKKFQTMSTVNANQHNLIRQAKLLQYANTKRNDGDFNDVTIQAGSESIPANRMVLACYSKFFESMFLSQLKERNQTTVEINEFDGWLIKSVIEYIYTGKICININNVMTLLGVADFLQVDDVKKACFNCLKNELTVDNCLDVLKAFVSHKNVLLLQHTYQFISENFEVIADKDNFTNLSKLDLTSLITNIDRKTVKESCVYTAIIKWVKGHQDRETEFSCLFLELDLQKMSSDFVWDVISAEQLVKDSNACLNTVISYFTSQAKALQKQDSKTNKTTRQQQKNKAKTKILCLGGESKNTVLELYNALDKPRNVYPNLPCNVSGHRVLKLDDFIYCLGGALERNTFDPTNKVYRLNLKAADPSWEEMTSMNKKRRDFGAATWNGNLVVAGGLFNCNFSVENSTELYDPRSKKWRTIASMNERRSDHDLVVANDKLFAIGGSDATTQCYSSVEQLDSVDGRWTFIKSMNVERCWFAAASCNNSIYAIGGSSFVEIHKTVEKYDFNENEWSFVKSMNEERTCHANCVLNEKIFVIGGKQADQNGIKSIGCYDPISNEWSVVGETEQTFWNHSVVAV